MNITIINSKNTDIEVNQGLIFYNKGEFVKAVKSFLEAIEINEKDYMVLCNLGVCCYNGKGVKQSFEKALPWYRKAAEQGNAAGQAGMAGIYATGHGVEQNFEFAFFLYTLASKQGHADSQNALGFMYEEGLGVEQDDELSEKWYEMACDGGNKMACTKI